MNDPPPPIYQLNGTLDFQNSQVSRRKSIKPTFSCCLKGTQWRAVWREMLQCTWEGTKQSSRWLDCQYHRSQTGGVKLETKNYETKKPKSTLLADNTQGLTKNKTKQSPGQSLLQHRIPSRWNREYMGNNAVYEKVNINSKTSSCEDYLL